MSSRRTSSVPRCCFSQNALLWFEVLADAHRFVAGAPRCCAMQRDPSPGRQAGCNSPSEGTRFCQSCQSRPEHPGFSDGNQGCCWWKWCNVNWLDAHCQQYHLISMNEVLLPNRVLPPAGWDHPEPSSFDYSRCIWMAIDKLAINDRFIQDIPGVPSPEDTTNEEPIDHQ